MQQSLVQGEWLNVAIGFRMGECFVDVVELDALGCKISLDRLQTGDVTEKWRSGEAAEYQYGIAPLHLSKFDRFPGGVVAADVWQLIADRGSTVEA